jgi:hypothetical protein
MRLTVLIYPLHPSSSSCGNVKYVAHLKKIKCLLQSFPAILEQCAHFSLAEKPLHFTATLLCLDKGMDLVKGSE